MIDLYFWPTPNGWKLTIMLEECGLPYRLKPVALDRGEQFDPAFQRISPNGRIPALVDHDPMGGGEPLGMFESGALLIYLAEKSGSLLPRDSAGRFAVIQWLMWQMSGFGPMIGQNGHFLLYAPEKVPYAIDRYSREARRLYGVLDKQLKSTGDCVAGEYSIADIALFPWIMTHKAQGIALDDFPAVRRWFATLRQRPKLQAGLAVGRDLRAKTLTDEAKQHLFGRRPVNG